MGINQCDGCAQGLELRGHMHYKNGRSWICCTAKLYKEGDDDGKHGRSTSNDLKPRNGNLGLKVERDTMRDTMIDIIELADALRKDYSKANKKAYDEARENLGDF